MKIKIRSDEAGAPGTSEWAAMHAWLAELREDDQADWASEGGTGTAQRASAGTAERASNGTDQRASNGTAERASAPTNGRTGSDGERPAQPAGKGPGTAEHGVTPRAGAPLNEYASRTRAGIRATVRAPARVPAEAPLVRAVIGDELRTPTAWCEMTSCISWHADRSALGEADVRARAIRAGWRIDALGRLACPQCQQTSASFRATRPVVLWDRATAIAMAARATARDSRPPGPAARAGAAARASDRGTRRPAHGYR